MKNKFWFLVKHGILKRVKTKGFVIASILQVTVMLIIALLPLFLSGVSVTTVYSVDLIVGINYDETEKVTQVTKDLLAETGYSFDYRSAVGTYDLTDPEKFYDLNPQTENHPDYIIYLYGDKLEELQVRLYAQNNFDSLVNISNALSNIRLVLLVDDNPVYTVSPLVVYPNPYHEEVAPENLILSLLFAFPMFLLVIICFQSIGVEIVEEKSTKAIEIIISSVSPSVHYYTKIISCVCFALINFLIMMVAYLLGSILTSVLLVPSTSGAVSLDPTSILLSLKTANIFLGGVYVLLFTVVGLLIESSVGAMLASLSNNQEDYGHTQAPMMILNTLFFYFAIYGPMLGANGVMAGLVYVPLLSVFIAPYLVAIGAINPLLALLSLLINVFTLWILNRIINPVYKEAILSFDGGKFSTRLKKYWRQAFPKKRK
jgi:ABC-2 type transport system permease protein